MPLLQRILEGALLASAMQAAFAATSPSMAVSVLPGGAAAARCPDQMPNNTPNPLPPDPGGDSGAQQVQVRGSPSPTTTATIADAPEYADDDLFMSAVLNSTNVFRHQHNASAAIWNATLARFAEAYLAHDSDCTFAHSGGPYGENIAVGFRSVHGAVDAWGNERSKFDFAHPSFSETTGHFTQLVWKTSTTVGCGRKLCGSATDGGGGGGGGGGGVPKAKSTGWFLVCEYWPRGNIVGQFAAQVGRQVSSDTGGTNPSSSSHANSSSGGRGGGVVGSEPPPGRPSSGVITGSFVVFVMLATVVFSDVRSSLADDTEHGLPEAA